MSPNFVMANKEGEPVFEMKRKTPKRPDGTQECYYLFRIYEENMPDEEVVAQFHEIFREFMCPLAAVMDVGLFSFDELAKRSNEQVKKLYDSGKELTEDQVDVTIEVRNYATGRLDSLVVGISTMTKEAMEAIKGKDR